MSLIRFNTNTADNVMCKQMHHFHAMQGRISLLFLSVLSVYNILA
jgi:hypothetical protein